GGSRDLVQHVGSDRPLYGLQPHGLDGRRAPTTVEEMAADYINEIQALQPRGPYLLGGFSFGGMVAFEMAHQLLKQGQQVSLLVLLDPTPPSRVDLAPPAILKINTPRSQVYRHWVNLKRSGPRERLTYVSERLRWRMQGMRTKMNLLVCKTCFSMRF